MRAACVLLVAIVPSVALASETPYTGGDIPEGAHIEIRHNDDFMRTAVLSTLSIWALNIWTAGIGDLVCNGSCKDHAYDLLYLPLVGPAIAAALPGTYRAGQGWSVILAADTALQVGCLVVGLFGYFFPMRRVVVPARAIANPPTKWAFAPSAPGAWLGATFTLSGF